MSVARWCRTIIFVIIIIGNYGTRHVMRRRHEGLITIEFIIKKNKAKLNIASYKLDKTNLKKKKSFFFACMFAVMSIASTWPGSAPRARRRHSIIEC